MLFLSFNFFLTLCQLNYQGLDGFSQFPGLLFRSPGNFVDVFLDIASNGVSCSKSLLDRSPVTLLFFPYLGYRVITFSSTISKYALLFFDSAVQFFFVATHLFF
ncbi:hypothetical protein F4809DRAFT_623994 [Biscogniauxia mediterranea]|nr:hypothetical protein F4809DRAFT_623994 [Biscogniauxia mediterranea]